MSQTSLFGRLSIFLLVLSFHKQITEACKCVERGLQQSYFEDGKDMMKVEVLGKVRDKTKTRLIATEKKRVHVAKVVTNYKGKTNKGEYILITSPLHSCGERLSTGSWLVSMNAVPNGGKEGGLGVYGTMACDYNSKWKKLSKKELAFLDTRMFCDEQGLCTCGDGTIAKMCKMSPCLPSTCEREDVQCLDNYCGGCRAEWINTFNNQLECKCMKGDINCGR